MKLLREPLFHFLVLGVALSLVYAVASDLLTTRAGRRIDITAADVQLMAENWERRWQRPPTETELRGLVEARVREEILYREALAVGLDENDAVVRRRMVQKVELLTQDLAMLADPTDQELQSFFKERQEDYRIPPLLTFSHVYFNMDERGAAGEEDARRVLAAIRAESPPPRRASERGDRFMLGYDYSLAAPDEVQRDLGGHFTDELFQLDTGWHGPIASAFGLHLVHIVERVEGRVPEYGQVRDRLVVDYNTMRRDRAKEALYEGLAQRYEISIDEEAIRAGALEGSEEDPG
jgi:hypothetical protein